MNKGIKWMSAVLMVFAVGVTAGAIFSVKTAPLLLYDYFKGLSGGEISIGVAGAVLSALVLWSILFFSAFFKFGAVTAGLTVAVSGFVDGYSIAAILRILGIKGLSLCFFDILSVPVMLILAADVTHFLFADDRDGSTFVIRSLILLLAMLSATLLSAFLSGKILSVTLAGFDF